MTDVQICHSSLQRRIDLTGAYNVRDLGGYVTRDGRHTQWGKFYRADALHRLSTDSQQTLINLGIRLVIDLRGTDELRVAQNVFVESEIVTYRNVSLMSDSSLSQYNLTPVHPSKLYRCILDTRKSEIREVLEYILAVDGEPILFHCAAGKDRTGVMAALLLDVAGVPHDIIADDYVLTNTYITPLLQELRDNVLPDARDSYEKFLECQPSYMLDTLKYLERQYGGGAGYLRRIGFTDEQIQVFRNNLVKSN